MPSKKAKQTKPTVRVVEDIKKYGKPSSTFTSGHIAEVKQLALVTQEHMSTRAALSALANSTEPTLAYYSSDGTPLQTHLKTSKQIADVVVRREGKQTVEYLMQVIFFRRIGGSGDAETVAVIKPPLPLSHGKTGLAIFSASLDAFPHLRQMGHTGVAVQFYCFDRAVYSSLMRRLKQHHQLLASHWGSTPPKPSCFR